MGGTSSLPLPGHSGIQLQVGDVFLDPVLTGVGTDLPASFGPEAVENRKGYLIVVSAIGRGILGPQDPPPSLPWTSQGLSTCSNHVPFTLGFTDLPGSPMGIPSESQHCCLPSRGQLPASPSLSSLCPGAGLRPSQAPNQVRKHGGAPWCPELRGPKTPGSFPSMKPGRKAGHHMTPGLEAPGCTWSHNSDPLPNLQQDLPGDEGRSSSRPGC